ncbi:MAG: peptide chain release factor N(5)-glutamine methyltransferase [Candidatus Melainabacteria bacterium]|nr:peptide chain release factor N(5)-glutamine methyltransferase [Candidatus Melainabacteria bacterium]
MARNASASGAYREIVERLVSFGIDKSEAKIEAALIIEHVCGIPLKQLHTFDFEVDDDMSEKIIGIILRREKREPIQYCLGAAHFMGRKLLVLPGVFIPRVDTEILVVEAKEVLSKNKLESGSILEIGIGTGAISTSLLCEFPQLRCTATDVSDRALECAAKNAALLNVQDRIEFHRSSTWWDLPGKGEYDLIISNPPYIPMTHKSELAPEIIKFEPHEALFGGGDEGLSFYEEIAARGADLAQLVALEIGDYQSTSVPDIFARCGWVEGYIERDLNGLPRVFCAKSLRNQVKS